jgi:hypothetical protein
MQVAKNPSEALAAGGVRDIQPGSFRRLSLNARLDTRANQYVEYVSRRTLRMCLAITRRTLETRPMNTILLGMEESLASWYRDRAVAFMA